MSAITRFLGDDNWRLSPLPDIDQRLSGKTIAEIKEKEPLIYSRIEDTTIAVTVIRCDLSKRSHQEYLFTIFHRLNTGGSKLTNQEIRNCIFSGKFNQLLKDLANDSDFLNVMNMKADKIDRFAAEEIILRSICFSSDYDNYNGKLASFLNEFMSKNRDLDDDALEIINDSFRKAISIILHKMLSGTPLPRFGKAFTEALLVGVLKNIESISLMTESEVKKRYNDFLSAPEFSFSALKEGLAAAGRVQSRLNRATEIFQ
jgi:hypothetical protein